MSSLYLPQFHTDCLCVKYSGNYIDSFNINLTISQKGYLTQIKHSCVLARKFEQLVKQKIMYWQFISGLEVKIGFGCINHPSYI